MGSAEEGCVSMLPESLSFLGSLSAIVPGRPHRHRGGSGRSPQVQPNNENKTNKQGEKSLLEAIEKDSTERVRLEKVYTNQYRTTHKRLPQRRDKNVD